MRTFIFLIALASASCVVVPQSRRGKLAGISGGKAQFSGALRNACALADLKMNRLLDTIDAFAAESGLDAEVEPPHRFPPTEVDESPPLGMDLTRGEIRTILWATGFAVDYSWMEFDAFDERGRPRHHRGVSVEPGVYFLGLPWQSRRGSSFIWGVWHDARYLADQITIQRGYQAYLPAAQPVAEATLTPSERGLDEPAALAASGAL